jgi:hypothetical protein
VLRFIPNNVQAFVLLGHHPLVTPATFAEWNSVKLKQKLSSEPKVERRYSSAPIAQMLCACCTTHTLFIKIFVFAFKQVVT